MANLLQKGIRKTTSEYRYLSDVAEHRTSLPQLAQDEATIVDTLDREGICITSLDALGIPSSQKMIEDALAVRDEMCEVGAKNNFFVLPSEEQRIANPSFFLWGLEPKLTRIVEAYIRLPISYLGVGLLRSKPDGDNSKSRCWHRDTQDRRHVKVTVYFNDVNEAGGPFQFLPHTVTPFFLPTWYSKVYKKNFMSDDKMSKFVSPDKWKSCTGASGTVIFFEPNGFHRGKIPTESERFAAIYKYASRHPKHPDFCDPHFSANELNTYQQYLTPEQKEMVWKIR